MAPSGFKYLYAERWIPEILQRCRWQEELSPAVYQVALFQGWETGSRRVAGS